MKYLFTILWVTWLNPSSAQTIDSIAIKKVDSLIQVSRELTGKSDFDKALQVNAEAEKIALEKLGHDSKAYGNSIFNRGRVNYFKGDYPASEFCYLEAKSIREKTVGKEHPLYANCLNNLALVFCKLGNYEKAEPLHLEAKTIREKALGKEHPDYAVSLNNLAVVYHEISNYEKAELVYLESKAIREKVLGKEHPDYAVSLINLALLYVKMGNHEKAEPLYLESIAIWEKVLGKEHPDYARSLSFLALLYVAMGNYEKAELLHLEAKAIFEKAHGKEHIDYASSLHNLANLYMVIGNYEKAEPLTLESKAILEKALGKEHPDYAMSLHNLALLYREMGNYQKVEPLFLEAKDLLEKALGKEHHDYTTSLYDLADLYEKQSRSLESEPLLVEAIARSQAGMIDATSFLSEQELAKYTLTFQSNGNNLIGYIMARHAIQAQHGTLPNLAYDHALFYKGFLLNAASRLNTLALTSPATSEINLRLKGYRRRLAAEYAMPIAERIDVHELEEKANLAEKELARSVAGYSEALRQVKWEDIKTVLKPSEAAVEFVHFKVSFSEKTDSMMYAALLILPGNEQPKFIPLFEEKSLDSLLHSKSERKADYVNALYTLSDRGAVAVETPKKSLYEILWKPLEKKLANVKTIYFSPSGLLHRINLDAIPVSETETLADKYQLIELNSTRQLVIPTQIKIANNDALLFGGIQFEQDTTVQNNEPLLASRSRGELSFQSVDTTLRGGSWNYLPGTEREVNAIEKMMQTSGVQVKLKKGYEATEESFKNIGANNNPSPRILHIATHGYFFPDRTSSAKSRMTYDSMASEGTAKAASTNLKILQSESEPVFKISDHPMLRSGLIMAGGNAAWQGKQTLEGREDGILTAYEISQMNLSNTELVVLSACETGLGDIQGNEGVYGLQRAFKIAGAKYLIMSLWQVPDKQTSLLMTTFYKNWLEAEGPDKGGKKMSIPDAFHAAQKELRDIGLDPYQWAGFVLVE